MSGMASAGPSTIAADHLHLQEQDKQYDSDKERNNLNQQSRKADRIADIDFDSNSCIFALLKTVPVIDVFWTSLSFPSVSSKPYIPSQ